MTQEKQTQGSQENQNISKKKHSFPYAILGKLTRNSIILDFLICLLLFSLYLIGNFQSFTDRTQLRILLVLSIAAAALCILSFLGIVVESRKLTYEEGKKLADGRIYTAKQALNNGLIDNISNWNEMIENLSVATTGDYYCNVKTYKYEKKPTFMESLLETMGMNIKNTAAYKVNQAAMPMYIYSAR